MADLAVKKPRVYLWDNVKALLIVLVVVGHFVTQYTAQSELMRSMFVIIYYFHMPLFVFVSGLFAKSSWKNGVLRVNKIIGYLILYVALKLIIFLEGLAFGKNVSFRLFYEAGIPWYMLAMAVFICTTYALKDIKPQVLIPITFVLALIAGYDSGINDVFALSRIIVFYPIFLLGFYTDSNVLANFTRKKSLRIASAILLIAFIVAAFMAPGFFAQLGKAVTARHPYASFPVPSLGPIYRALAYIAGAILSFAVICVLPNKQIKISYIGAATLPIYFLHRPILYVIMDSGLGDLIVKSIGGELGMTVFLVLAVVLAFVLSAKPLSVPFNKIMKCKYGGVINYEG